jgi:hypothetical protein
MLNRPGKAAVCITFRSRQRPFSVLQRARFSDRSLSSLTAFFKPQHVGDSLQSMEEQRARSERSKDREQDSDEDLVLSDTDASGHKWLLCHLDSADDPVMVLHQLRECISERGAALLEVNDSNPHVALDAMLLLCLLEADLESKIVFRPLRQRAENSCMILRVCKAKQKGSQRASGPIVQVKRPTHIDNPSPSEMLQQARGLADQLLSRVDKNTMACIESENPTELIVALRALKIARKIVRSEGNEDLYISPQVVNYGRHHSIISFQCWVKSTQTPSDSHSGSMSGRIFFP